MDNICIGGYGKFGEKRVYGFVFVKSLIESCRDVEWVYTLSGRENQAVQSPHSKGEDRKCSAVYVVTRSTLGP
jgi:hypothetical protein